MVSNDRLTTICASLARCLETLDVTCLDGPVQIIDPTRTARQIDVFQRALTRVKVYYAYKCAPDLKIVEAIDSATHGYDIASIGEFRQLRNHGIAAERMLFSHPVKPERHIQEAFEGGVRLFTYQSADELDKFARVAPTAQLLLRLDVSVGDPIRHKFGAQPARALGLLKAAISRGLQPVGITFHVGTQTTDALQWIRAIQLATKLMHTARTSGIDLTILDIGGGFPVDYEHASDNPFLKVTDAIRPLLAMLPAELTVIAEPGRFIAADSACLVTSVTGVDTRAEWPWVHIDSGIFQGLAEAWEFGRLLQRVYPLGAMEDIVAPYACTLAGPTCDDLDVIAAQYTFSYAPKSGDVLVIAQTGAYVDAYTTTFNGMHSSPTLYI
jgi:ornithine decarboxylase